MIEIKIYLAVMSILAAGAVKTMIKEIDYKGDNNASNKSKTH